jgi:hypothetical protein
MTYLSMLWLPAALFVSTRLPGELRMLFVSLAERLQLDPLPAPVSVLVPVPPVSLLLQPATIAAAAMSIAIRFMIFTFG